MISPLSYIGDIPCDITPILYIVVTSHGILGDSKIGVISHDISHGIIGGSKIGVISPEISHEI